MNTSWFSENWGMLAQDLAVIAGLGFVVWLVIHGARSDRWRRAWLRLSRDRVGIISGCVIALYLLIGALELIEVPAGSHRTASILQLITANVPAETTYSAPLAKT